MDSCHVEMIGHASIMLRSGGKTLVTDPWYVDPVSCNTLFHWPPLVRTPEEIAERTDAIWISHNHSDHFDPPSLAIFPRSIPIYIGDYTDKSYLRQFDGLGFKVVEVPFQRRFEVPGTEFVITLLESDYAESASFDSSIIVEASGYTLFNNNDCYLKQDKYDWIKDRYNIDYGFLGYSPASFYPICFEFEKEEKDRLLEEAADRRYADFVNVAQELAPTLSVPFAMGMRFLHESMLWQNVSFNSAHEAVRRLERSGLRGEVLVPGDRVCDGATVERKVDPGDGRDELDRIAAYAREKREWINSLWEQEPPARPTIVDDFKRYLRDLWARGREHYPEAAQYVVEFRIEGEHEAVFWLDLKRESGDVVVPGEAPSYDISYTYLDRLLQLRMDGDVDWDDLNFSNRGSVRQNRYPAHFYALLRAEGAPPEREIGG